MSDDLVKILDGNTFVVSDERGDIEASLTDFRDVTRLNDIEIGPDLGGTGHQALNFTGSAGAVGETWITVYDPAPNPPPVRP